MEESDKCIWTYGYQCVYFQIPSRQLWMLHKQSKISVGIKTRKWEAVQVWKLKRTWWIMYSFLSSPLASILFIHRSSVISYDQHKSLHGVIVIAFIHSSTLLFLSVSLSLSFFHIHSPYATFYFLYQATQLLITTRKKVSCKLMHCVLY